MHQRGGAINALTMKPAGVLHDEALGRLALEMVAECVAVDGRKARGWDDSVGQQVLDMYRGQPRDSVEFSAGGQDGGTADGDGRAEWRDCAAGREARDCRRR